jgi:signal recognition particle receptor subunit beta
LLSHSEGSEEHKPERGDAWDEEEEFPPDDEDDDGPRLDDCFAELEKGFTWDEDEEGDIIAGLRSLDYNVGRFVRVDKAKDREDRLLRPIKQPGRGRQKKGPVPRSLSLERLQQHSECKRTGDVVAAEVGREKVHVNFFVIGHVDAGKSTLIGNLLVSVGSVSREAFAKLQKEAEAVGKANDTFAWVMEEDPTERERGVTISAARAEFETPNRSVTVVDCPGHRDYVANTIAGACQPDAALLVVDATRPLADCLQAREHLRICKALGIGTVVAVVNKMDAFRSHGRIRAGAGG